MPCFLISHLYKCGGNEIFLEQKDFVEETVSFQD